MASTQERLKNLKHRLMLTGALFVASSTFSGVSAQNSVDQDKQQNKQEEVISKEKEGVSYCNLVDKLWDMYRLVYADGTFFNSLDYIDGDKCQDFFKKYPEIKNICQNADRGIGGKIRGPRTLSVAEIHFPNLRSELNQKLSSNIIQEIDSIGNIKKNMDDENITDKIWRMYTYVTTHGGVDKKNSSADFFKKYPEFYQVCHDAGVAMNDAKIPLERTTYSDVMYYNLKSDNPFNMSKKDWLRLQGVDDFDGLIDKVLYEITEDRKINEGKIISDIENIKVPNAGSKINNSKRNGNTYMLGY